MDAVEAAERKIRDIVNSPRRRQALLHDRQKWLRLCSAMDAIGDTQMAVRAYLDEPNDAKSKGWSYLAVYGVLQVLYVQQDAAKTLANCLALTLELPSEIEDIREIRNDSIGHPTGRGTFISRISLSTGGFQMIVPVKKGKREFRSVKIRAAAEQQTVIMGRLLNDAVEQLVSDELVHRKQFRDRPLRAALPHALGYATEKIGAGLREAAERPMALGGVEVIRTAVANLRQMIEERGLTVAYKDSIGETASEVEHALNRIQAQLEGAAQGWDERDGEVYWFFLLGKIRELQNMAHEVDRDYESDDVL